MKYLMTLLAAALISPVGFAEQSQYFNAYGGSITVKSVDFQHFSMAFYGTEASQGEVVFELLDDDQSGHREIYKASFIPNDIELFPYVIAGFYSKKLIKIDLLNYDKARDLLFTANEWEEAATTKKAFISKKGLVTIKNYATSVECDSRQYYAEISDFKKETNDLAMFDTRNEMSGC